LISYMLRTVVRVSTDMRLIRWCPLTRSIVVSSSWAAAWAIISIYFDSATAQVAVKIMFMSQGRNSYAMDPVTR
jgi:hypothetical protein